MAGITASLRQIKKDALRVLMSIMWADVLDLLGQCLCASWFTTLLSDFCSYAAATNMELIFY